MTADEAFGMGGVGVGEDGGSGGLHLGRQPVVDHRRREQADPAVTVLLVIPAEERAAERAGILERAEPAGKGRAVLEGLELRLGEGVEAASKMNVATSGDRCVKGD